MKPWEELHISKATYYRRKKKDVFFPMIKPMKILTIGKVRSLHDVHSKSPMFVVFRGPFGDQNRSAIQDVRITYKEDGCPDVVEFLLFPDLSRTDALLKDLKVTK